MHLSLKLTLALTAIATPLALYFLLRLTLPLLTRLTPDRRDHSTPTSGLLTEFQSYIEPQIKRVEEHRRQSQADLHNGAASPNPPRPR